MSSFSVITSLNQKYYNDVGYRMVESFLEYWPVNINLYIYSEESLNIKISNERLKVINLLDAQPSLGDFISRGKKRPDAKLLQNSLKKGAIRFSFKSFTIIDGALNIPSDYIIWHDADMVTHKSVDTEFLESLVSEDTYSVFLGRANTYTETGFLIFNRNLEINRTFMESWRKIYEDDEIYNLDEWHDCKCYDKLRMELKTNDHNLSPWGKDYDHVFINSVLGKYFDHLKGERKNEGASNATDISIERNERYWQKIKKSLITVVCVSDQYYLKYLKTLILSASKHSKNICFEVLLVNINDKQETENDLIKISEFINITFTDKEFNSSMEKKSFCANSRVKFIKELLEKGTNKILYLDADSLVRKDLQKYNWDFENSDIEILFRETEEEEKFKFATGVIAVSNSTMSKEFFQSWHTEIEPVIHTWFADQITFYRVFMKYKNDVRFRHLSQSMIDWKFHPDSTVWVGKGNRKYRNLIYLLENYKATKASYKLLGMITIFQKILNLPYRIYIKIFD